VHLGLGGDPQSALVKPRKEAQLETSGEWHKVELLYHHIIGHLRSASAQTVLARKSLDSMHTQFSILVHNTRPNRLALGHAHGLVYIPSVRIHAPASTVSLYLPASSGMSKLNCLDETPLEFIGSRLRDDKSVCGDAGGNGLFGIRHS